MTKIWKPEVFQGRGKKKDYFEGWYFKSVSKDEKIAYAIIAGLSITKNPGNSHAFVMFVDAQTRNFTTINIHFQASGQIKKNLKLRLIKTHSA